MKNMIAVLGLVLTSSTVFASQTTCFLSVMSKTGAYAGQKTIGTLKQDGQVISRVQDGFDISIFRDKEQMVSASIGILESGLTLQTGSISIAQESNIDGTIIRGFNLGNQQKIDINCFQK